MAAAVDARKKRFLDLSLGVFLLVVCAPVMAVVSLAIWLTMGSPVVFRQKRPGYQARLFTIYKFRTMDQCSDEKAGLDSDAQRLTRLGRFLRKNSLDELPELFNVIRGDMSLVGPRPLLEQYLPRYSCQQARRHEVKPGMTGWAQINGRNAITWEDKFKLDVWYVDNRSIWLDMKIIFLTIGKIITREGINQPGSATAEEFLGTGKGK